MKIIVLYEQKKYISEMKQTFTAEDLISNMRKILGDKENQNYTLTDYNGKFIQPNHFFYPDDKEKTFILMKIPIFNPEEPLYNDNIEEDIINATDSIINKINYKSNHGNQQKKRESSKELIANIYGSYNDLPDLVKETMKK